MSQQAESFPNTVNHEDKRITGNKARTIRVAAIQMEFKNGPIEANLERATPMVNRAAEKGAKLILLPEFMPTGYIFSAAIWGNGEPKEGQTVKWLRESSKRLGVWLGTSFS
jgi:N-carbamoylputrescine amidase